MVSEKALHLFGDVWASPSLLSGPNLDDDVVFPKTSVGGAQQFVSEILLQQEHHFLLWCVTQTVSVACNVRISIFFVPFDFVAVFRPHVCTPASRLVPFECLRRAALHMCSFSSGGKCFTFLALT